MIFPARNYKARRRHNMKIKFVNGTGYNLDFVVTNEHVLRFRGSDEYILDTDNDADISIKVIDPT